jgi:hypothetical protein
LRDIRNYFKFQIVLVRVDIVEDKLGQLLRQHATAEFFFGMSKVVLDVYLFY